MRLAGPAKLKKSRGADASNLTVPAQNGCITAAASAIARPFAPRWLLILGFLFLVQGFARPENAADRRTDPSTLTGKVMCGYQAWFACEGDGAERGWVHWTKGREIGRAHV